MPTVDPRRARRLTGEGGVRIGSGGSRLQVLPSVRKPLKVGEAAIVRRDLLKESSQWFTVHRRGVRRPWVGADPLESRAVSEYSVKGYLHERVVYRWLTQNGFVPGADFDFQSSQDGGRQEIGGIVVDFLFPTMKIALGVDGPTHQALLQARKDEEQKQLLAEMGYWSIAIDIALIQNEAMFDQEMRRIFQGRGAYNNLDMSPELQAELDVMQLEDSMGDIELAMVRLEQVY